MASALRDKVAHGTTRAEWSKNRCVGGECMRGTWASLALLVVAGFGCDACNTLGERDRDRGDGAAPVHVEQRLSKLFTAEGGPVVPGEPPRGLSGTAPSDCAGCHAEIAAEWASSAHARSGAEPPPRLDVELADPQATEVSWSLELFRLAPEDARKRGLDDAARGLRVLSGRVAVQAL